MGPDEKNDEPAVTLQNLQEKTLVFGKRVFAMAVDRRIPKTQNTLLDENIMIKLGIKPTKVMSKRFAYGGVMSRIVAEARFTAQTVCNGVTAGNTFLKVIVVRDLSLYYGVDAIAGGKLYNQLSSTDNDDSFTGSVTAMSTPRKQHKPKKKDDLQPRKEKGNNTPDTPKLEVTPPSTPARQGSPPASRSPAGLSSSPHSQASQSSTASSCGSTCSTCRTRRLGYEMDTFGRIRAVRVPIQDSSSDDVWDNVSVVLENQPYPGHMDTVQVQQAVALSYYDRLPPGFFPCEPSSCHYHLCNCIGQYDGRDFSS